MNGPMWSDAELEYLQRLAGEHPLPALTKRMRMRALTRGWPTRSQKAIVDKLHHLGLPARPRTDNCTTTYGAAELLGLSGDRVSKWLQDAEIREILMPRTYGRAHYIIRDGWRRLARARPYMFAGIPADNLFSLLEDRDLADSIAAAYPCGRTDWRVRCRETGKVWNNCKEAGAALNVHHSTITLAIRRSIPVPILGLTFERLNKS